MWFRAKRYGWGWTPSTRQGWFAILVYVVLMLFTAFGVLMVVDETPLETAPVTMIVLYGLWTVWTAALLALCYHRGEKPSWRWGVRREKTIAKSQQTE